MEQERENPPTKIRAFLQKVSASATLTNKMTLLKLKNEKQASVRIHFHKVH